MDELAAAAAVVAMSIDDDGLDDSELEDARDAAGADDVPVQDCAVADANKENEDVLPGDGARRAVDRKVILRSRTQDIRAMCRP